MDDVKEIKSKMAKVKQKADFFVRNGIETHSDYMPIVKEYNALNRQLKEAEREFDLFGVSLD